MSATPKAAPERALLRANAWRGMARFVAYRWWQRHPVQTATAAVEPALRDCAQRHPWRLLSGAAALGSAFVLTRAWRLAPRAWLWRTALSHGVAAALLLSRRRR